MSKNKKIKWLNRTSDLLPHYCLCLEEDAFHREVKRLGADPVSMLASKTSDATAHYFVMGSKECVIVTLDACHVKYDLMKVLALLTHEAVHIWQWYCESIGEDKPGKEHEAYVIQGISQNLWESYIEQTGRKKV